MAAALPEIRERLLAPNVDLASHPLLARSPEAPVRPPLSLHLLRRLDEIEERVGRGGDPATTSAEKALVLVGAGELDLAAAALANAPEHHLADYAFAALHLARAQVATREANYYTLQAREVDPDHESHWEAMAESAAGGVFEGRREAFRRLVRAYRTWPFHEWKGQRIWDDDVRRRQVAAQIALLAFGYAHDHESVEMEHFDRIRRRRLGEPVETYFGVDIDAVVLGIAHDLERYTPIDLRLTTFQAKTLVLQLYFVLSPADYDRFAPRWVASMDKDDASAIAHMLMRPGRWNTWSLIVREHLQRNLDEAARRALTQALAERHVGQIREVHAAIGDFLVTDPKTQPVDEDDWDAC
ncbi:MAG: hypothetical protein U1F43_00370 [Myxococcota bacterium]